MIDESVKYLLKDKYDKFIVFIHNFSYFDSIFLLKTLYNLSDKIKPTLRDGRFIDFKLKFNKKLNLYFRDSLLMLPLSLSKLAKNFNLDSKDIFPYTFVNNKHIPLDYIGKVPRFKFLSLKNISLAELAKYITSFKNKPWNLREETIKYCEKDCVLLYKILKQFNEIIFTKFNVDTFKYPTISSLAFAIFRTNYLEKDKIPLITGKIYDELKPSYTGGACDVYKPMSWNNKDKKIYAYDVNSLYPFVMKSCEMPMGIPTYFEGDIAKIKDNPFGFLRT
jgi:hypothetical protein